MCPRILNYLGWTKSPTVRYYPSFVRFTKNNVGLFLSKCFIKAKVIQRWVIVAEILRTRRKAKFIATKSPFLSHFARSNRTFIH